MARRESVIGMRRLVLVVVVDGSLDLLKVLTLEASHWLVAGLNQYELVIVVENQKRTSSRKASCSLTLSCSVLSVLSRRVV